MRKRAADAGSDGLRSLDLVVRKIEDAENDLFPWKFFQYRTIERRLGCLDRNLVNARICKFGEEGVTGRPLVNDGGITETQVNRGLPATISMCSRNF